MKRKLNWLFAAGVGARWHMGFISAISAVWDQVLARINAEVEKDDRPVWVTGHSLGGALAHVTYLVAVAAVSIAAGNRSYARRLYV